MMVVGFTERVPFEKRCEGGVRHEAVCKNITRVGTANRRTPRANLSGTFKE